MHTVRGKEENRYCPIIRINLSNFSSLKRKKKSVLKYWALSRPGLAGEGRPGAGAGNGRAPQKNCLSFSLPVALKASINWGRYSARRKYRPFTFFNLLLFCFIVLSVTTVLQPRRQNIISIVLTELWGDGFHKWDGHNHHWFWAYGMDPGFHGTRSFGKLAKTKKTTISHLVFHWLIFFPRRWCLDSPFSTLACCTNVLPSQWSCKILRLSALFLFW